jgi:hypothetical protein
MKYLSIRNGSFMFIDHMIGPAIETPVILAGKRFIKWGPTGFEGQMDCHDETKIPQGWTLAYDLDLMVAGEPYRFTIHGGVIEFGFKPYLAELASRKLPLESTPARISVITKDDRSFPQFNAAPQGCVFDY